MMHNCKEFCKTPLACPQFIIGLTYNLYKSLSQALIASTKSQIHLKLEQTLTKIAYIHCMMQLRPKKVSTSQRKFRFPFIVVFNACSSNMCMTRDLYFTKMHLAKNNIEIQCIFTLHRNFNGFFSKNLTDIALSSVHSSCKQLGIAPQFFNQGQLKQCMHI